MKIKIYKYEIPTLQDQFTLEMPEIKQFLSLQMQNDKHVMWWTVDTESPLVNETFRIVMTGEDITDSHFIMLYLGTFQLSELVLHVFKNNTNVGL
jgi:hypothetical protein